MQLGFILAGLLSPNLFARATNIAYMASAKKNQVIDSTISNSLLRTWVLKTSKEHLAFGASKMRDNFFFNLEIKRAHKIFWF